MSGMIRSCEQLARKIEFLIEHRKWGNLFVTS